MLHRKKQNIVVEVVNNIPENAPEKSPGFDWLGFIGICVTLLCTGVLGYLGYALNVQVAELELQLNKIKLEQQHAELNVQELDEYRDIAKYYILGYMVADVKFGDKESKRVGKLILKKMLVDEGLEDIADVYLNWSGSVINFDFDKVESNDLMFMGIANARSSSHTGAFFLGISLRILMNSNESLEKQGYTLIELNDMTGAINQYLKMINASVYFSAYNKNRELSVVALRAHNCFGQYYLKRYSEHENELDTLLWDFVTKRLED